MKIQVRSFDADNCLVEFACAAEIATGYWDSDMAVPRPETAIHVELDIDDPLVLGENVESTDAREATIVTAGSTNVLVCCVESVDDDGMAYLRVSDNCLVMAECDISEIGEGDWLSVKLAASDLRVSPS